jgi:CRP-like cAMP-binding protein
MSGLCFPPVVRHHRMSIRYVFSRSDSLPRHRTSVACYDLTTTTGSNLVAMFNLPSSVCIGRSYAPKREIVSEDDLANRVYEVVSGTVCTYKMLREGRRQISGFYFAGDVFGLESVQKRTVAARAITKAEVRVIKKTSVDCAGLVQS